MANMLEFLTVFLRHARWKKQFGYDPSDVFDVEENDTSWQQTNFVASTGQVERPERVKAKGFLGSFAKEPFSSKYSPTKKPPYARKSGHKRGGWL